MRLDNYERQVTQDSCDSIVEALFKVAQLPLTMPNFKDAIAFTCLWSTMKALE